MSELTAADYLEWAEFAGIYLGNVSKAELYRAYQAKLSQAGLVTRIVHDFLEDNRGGIDIPRWRSGAVYEMGGDAAFRIEQTARALEAIGAKRTAAKVRTAEDTSLMGKLGKIVESGGTYESMLKTMQGVNVDDLMAEFRQHVSRAFPQMAAQTGMPLPSSKPTPLDPEVESWEQIEQLFVGYLSLHERQLRGDMETIGDVRQEPGFDPHVRREELQQLYRKEIRREQQREAAGKLEAVMEQIRLKVAQKPDAGPEKFDSERSKFQKLVREFSREEPVNLIESMRACLETAARMQIQFAAILDPPPVADEKLLARLATFGPYDTDLEKKRVTICWPRPAGLECDWTTLSLSLEFPLSRPKTLARQLDACERLRKRFAKVQADMRQEVLDHFAIYREDTRAWMWTGYELGTDSKPTPESALAHVEGGTIHVEGGGTEDSDVSFHVFMGVEWDPEHGLELDFDDERESAGSLALESIPKFCDGGPLPTDADLAAFEQQTGIKLPGDYRQFVLLVNGGRPEPNHYSMQQRGETWPLEIEYLLALSELPAALAQHREHGHPANYLPIGYATAPDPMSGNMELPLLLGLAGKNAGKIIGLPTYFPAAMGTPAEMPYDPQMLQQTEIPFETICLKVAPSLTTFLEKIGAPK